MKQVLLFNICCLALLLYVPVFGQQQATNGSGTLSNFNRNWKFSLGDVRHGEDPGLNDEQWEAVGLPHSFSIPYFMSPDFYTGFGWYRKHFAIEKVAKDKKFFLEFEAVFQEAEIFVNGKKIGSHTGGYTGFIVDISQAVHEGDNVVAVRVNNIWKPGLAPRAGEHVFSGGIYRDVFFVTTADTYIDWCGIAVTTPQVSAKQAMVNVETVLKNDADHEVTIRLQTIILDPKGKQVAKAETVHNIRSGTPDTILQKQIMVGQPQLWNTDQPSLYSAVTTVFRNGQKIDDRKTEFGIRTIKWTADQGFFLNGKHLYLRGVNVHQDHAGWGDAVTNAGIYRDVKMMKDAGFNFIRGSHYPHDPAFAAACDKLGMLFWSESNFWGIGGSDRTPEGYWNSSAYPTKAEDTAAFRASITQQLREMIRIHRNHPSIIAWSISNEPFFTARQTVMHMRELLKTLVDEVHRLDSTRPAAVGGSQRPLDSLRIDRLGDLAGYNGDGGTLSVFQNPGVPNIVSEYGSTTADRPGKYEPGWGDLARDSGRAKYAWRSGQAIWCGFDHGSIAGSALGKMGIVDYFRIPKRAYYWYRNEYAKVAPPQWPQPGTPAALRLEADKTFAATDGTDDIKLLVTVLDAKGKPISNNPDVTLKILSGPGEFPTGPSISFSEKSDIRILDGQAAIELRSFWSGKCAVQATSPGLAPATVSLTFTGPYAYVKGVTPQSPVRPYTRFTRKQTKVTQSFGRNNPTFASSALEAHPAGLAADGENNTWWQPAAGDHHPCWTLDTEKNLAVSGINISFPQSKAYRYVVQVSSDHQHWTTVADNSTNTKTEDKRQIQLNGVEGSIIRICFEDNSPAALAEVEVLGTVLE